MEAYVSITQKEFNAAPVYTTLELKASNGVKASAIKHAKGRVLQLGRSDRIQRCIFPSLKAWKGSFGSVDYVIFAIKRADTRGLPTRVKPITLPTKDVTMVRDLRDTLRDKVDILHVEGVHKIHPDICLEELMRLLNSSNLSNTDRYILMKCYTGAKSSYERLSTFWKERFPNHTSYVYASPPNATLYIFNATENKYEPIYYMKVADANAPDLDTIDELENYRTIKGQGKRIRYLLANILEIPEHEFIYFRKTHGVSFAEVGVPLGSNGKPEFWYVNSDQEFVKVE